MGTRSQRWLRRLTAVVLGLSIGGAAVAAPRPVRGAVTGCRMACAGTARCCCRPPAGQATASPVPGFQPSIQAVVSVAGCPKGCAVVRATVGAAGGAPPPCRAVAVDPGPVVLRSGVRSNVRQWNRLSRAIRPRAPPASRSVV